MIRSKYISVIVAVTMCMALLGSIAMAAFAGTAAAQATEYEKKLFNGDIVTIDIQVDDDDWQSLLQNAQSKEYISADLVINGDLFSNVGIRTKGNSSLNQTGSSTRYSLQFNPGKYVSGQSFYGLDAMCINNMMSDATYMKDAISYDIMNYLGVPSPLTNYASVTVNGEAHGLFLLLERYDESFLDRVYNTTAGELYNVKIGMGERSGFEAGEMEPVRPGALAADGQAGRDTMTEGTADFLPGSFDGAEMPDMQGQTDVMPEEDRTVPDGVEDQDGMTLPDDMEFPESTGEEDALSPPGGREMTPPDSMDDADASRSFEDSVEGDETGIADPFEAIETDTDVEETPAVGSGGRQQAAGNMGGFSGGGGSLVYTDDDPDSYYAIFDNAVSNEVSDRDKVQMVTAIEKLNAGEDLEDYWDVDEILRYLAAHTFVVNLDSYISSMQQNYYLYENNGVVSVLPWDYNLAFGGFQSSDAASVVNFPIDTPVTGVELEDRPLVSQLLAVEEYLERYHAYLNEIVEGYVGSGLFAEAVARIDSQIGEFVKTDATAYYSYEAYETAVETLVSFVELRAESVAGQLDGSVPSTTDAQSQNPQLLIDTGDLSLSDMGTQGGAGGDLAVGGFVQSRGNGAQASREESEPGNETDFSEYTALEYFGFGNGAPDIDAVFEAVTTFNEGGLMEFESNGMAANGSAERLTMQDWMIYGAMAAVLLAALLFMARFERRKWRKKRN